MNPKVALGADSFRAVIEKALFYIDKTPFIRDWWETEDKVTLITRPRRFGKTLNMSMLECFFSSRYAGRSDLFEGLEIWKDEKYRALQGTFPVISVSFSAVKDPTFKHAIFRICSILKDLVDAHKPLLESSPALSEDDKKDLKALRQGLSEQDDRVAGDAIHLLSKLIFKAEGKNVIILLDEYDAPLQEAWMYGYWKEMSSFMRSLFNYTFKSNSFQGRGLLTGVTRVSKESMFSDLNNLRTVSVLTEGRYETAFGFTEEEVFAAMDRYGFSDRQGVKKMYDGFIFGSRRDIYNPWSIINYLSDGGNLKRWWVNTSANELVNKLIREGNPKLKVAFGDLLQGLSLKTEIDEYIVFSSLEDDPVAVWSLLVEAGYLKASPCEDGKKYEVSITNGEVREMFDGFVDRWFGLVQEPKNAFARALLRGNIGEMNKFMSEVASETIGIFDAGTRPSPVPKKTERFYHGFVLGLIVELRDRFFVKSNGESGKGRYDVMLEPRDKDANDGFILEFKVINRKKEGGLPDTVENALAQIDKQRYDMKLLERGIPSERIHKYGIAFCGKDVLIDDKSGVGRKAYADNGGDWS